MARPARVRPIGNAVLAAGLLVAIPAQAQDSGAGGPQPAALRDLQACRSLSDNARRLACYDAAAENLSRSVETRELLVLDKQEVRKTRRSLFGFALPNLSLFGDRPDAAGKKDKPDAGEEAFTELTSKVVTVTVVPRGYVRFTIEDGAVWQTSEPITFPPKAGEAVTIRKAALGSYFIRFGKARAVKGMRVG
ncbi:hypothetical protein GVO57_05380 [Sphingomonas changnyeongensis]|uniref:Uncharacterized protein n=1 Tax=Sphingomonas changnyeongensis TaxID=2698679 RepID=A0A7Z2NVS0_9SPHN|nr:hypothetical protein [Sphingomonas changnyeongensis]QHL90371.1 hypothetical protein GVO57_05380 [Sphingomonas changnyeongensis]